ncbi:hypothetical protein THRCLA_04182 [Thraustotheca clavata]|uniref:Uncharacterized protein n=1 Tax=Thraustotheca clavata TaxID=74557 RepID=A0A1V9ZZW7_9STRA|nr:hypothetical protein THRCLA_04182 [Thraustotheca clavata]
MADDYVTKIQPIEFAPEVSPKSLTIVQSSPSEYPTHRHTISRSSGTRGDESPFKRRSSVMEQPTVRPVHPSFMKSSSMQALGIKQDPLKSPMAMLARKPSIAVPNLDMKQFEKDSELLLLINQLKSELKLSQDENTSLLKELGTKHREDSRNAQDFEFLTSKAVRYSDEKVRQLEMENARLRQLGNQYNIAEDKKRIRELEDALKESKKIERRALRLVVIALGKEQVQELLQAPGMNQKSLEERVQFILDKKKPKRKPCQHKRPQSASPTKARSAADKAIADRCQELDSLWKKYLDECIYVLKYCDELSGPSKDYAGSLRR